MKGRLKLRESCDVQQGSVFFNVERDSMLRVLRVYDVWCQTIGVPGGRHEKHVDYITWRPDGAKSGTRNKMRLDSLLRLPYFQVNAVHVYCVGGQSFGFDIPTAPSTDPLLSEVARAHSIAVRQSSEQERLEDAWAQRKTEVQE